MTDPLDRQRRAMRDAFVSLTDFCWTLDPQLADITFTRGVVHLSWQFSKNYTVQQQFIAACFQVLMVIATLPVHIRHNAAVISINTMYDVTDLSKMNRLAGFDPALRPLFRPIL